MIDLDTIYRTEGRRVLATLIRLLGGFEAAEEALHDAFAAAAEQWPRDGVPANPYAWLVSAGRFRTIDRWRRNAKLDNVLPDLALLTETAETPTPQAITDDELRLIFICCHPILPPDGRIALTLREVAGLTTEQIARAYLAPTPTIAQRIVRTKTKIRDERLPYEVPPPAEWPARLDSVLQVIYLIFNEAYAATEGPDLTRPDLGAEAIRLGRLLADLTDDAEALGLMALMLLHEARRPARTDTAGDLILLDDQNRTLWTPALITEAHTLIDRATAKREIGPFLVQAAIAATHMTTSNWSEIVALYDTLVRIAPSPVASLNRAVAVAMRDGPEAGLLALSTVMQDGALDDYHLAHAAVADLHRRLGHTTEARQSYTRALALARLPAERRFLQSRLNSL